MTNDFRKLESPSAERNKGPIWEVLASRVLPPILEEFTRRSPTTGANQHTAKNDGANDDGLNETNDKNVIRVLEIASGAGVHMQYFALNMLKLLEERRQQIIVSDSKPEPNVTVRWYPTDPCRSSLASQRAYRHEHNDLLSSVIHEPLQLTLNDSGIMEPDTAQQLESVANSAGGGFHLVLCINMVHIAPWSATLALFQVASHYLHLDANSDAALVLYGPFRVKGTMVDSNVRFDDWLKGQDPNFGVRNLEDVVQVANRAGLQLAETIEMPANNLCLVFRRRRRHD